MTEVKGAEMVKRRMVVEKKAKKMRVTKKKKVPSP